MSHRQPSPRSRVQSNSTLGASDGCSRLRSSRHFCMSSASLGKRLHNASHPEIFSCTGISTNPVIASQKASQLQPYQPGNPSASLRVEWSSSALITPFRSICTSCGRVIVRASIVFNGQRSELSWGGLFSSADMFDSLLLGVCLCANGPVMADVNSHFSF